MNLITLPTSERDPSKITAAVRQISERVAFGNQAQSGKLFKAVGDGVTDDTAAIQAWLNAGGPLYLPAGTYKVTSTLSVKSNTTIIGDGQTKSIITISGGGSFSLSSVTDVEVFDIKIIRTDGSTTSDDALTIMEACQRIRFERCWISCTNAGIGQVGNNSVGTTTPTYVTIANCRMDGKFGFRGRTALDVPESAYARIINNNVTITGDDVGIEWWQGAALIQGNIVIGNPSFVNSFSGITIGAQRHCEVLANIIYGFALGIEIGNIASRTTENTRTAHNLIMGCAQGWYLTGDGTETEVVSDCDTVLLDDRIRTDYTLGFGVKNPRCRLNSPKVVHIKSDGSYAPSVTTNADCKYTGIYGDTNVERLTIVNPYLANLENGIQFASSTFSSLGCSVVGGELSYCEYPFNDTGGNPWNRLEGVRLKNCGPCIVNKKFSLESCDLWNDPACFCLNKPWAQCNPPGNVVLINRGNRFTNVENTAFEFNGNYYNNGNGYTRPVIEITDFGINAQTSTSEFTTVSNPGDAATQFSLLDIGTFRTPQKATVTITIASPGVVSWTAHGFTTAVPVVFTTTGALPTGITAGTVYWVVPTSIAANSFQIATSFANAVAPTPINTSGSQSGTHTGTSAPVAPVGAQITDWATGQVLVRYSWGWEGSGTAAPTTGSWNKGDRVGNQSTAAAGVPGWRVTTAGTAGAVVFKAEAALAP